jgi:hypothetical protein
MLSFLVRKPAWAAKRYVLGCVRGAFWGAFHWAERCVLGCVLGALSSCVFTPVPPRPTARLELAWAFAAPGQNFYFGPPNNVPSPIPENP